MAKPAAENRARQDSKEARSGAAAERGPLADARAALARGDVRLARRALAAVGSDSAAADREQARALADSLGFDRAALGAALAVFTIIALAAALALFARHG